MPSTSASLILINGLRTVGQLRCIAFAQILMAVEADNPDGKLINGFLIRMFLTYRRSLTSGFAFSDLEFWRMWGRDVIGSRRLIGS
jgi:hypothetical protein